MQAVSAKEADNNTDAPVAYCLLRPSCLCLGWGGWADVGLSHPPRHVCRHPLRSMPFALSGKARRKLGRRHCAFLAYGIGAPPKDYLGKVTGRQTVVHVSKEATAAAAPHRWRVSSRPMNFYCSI